ncbi:ABC transporter permease [Nonomuraea sp. NPDC059194]|uniref:ABC transporter permease n=1 Tax=Nonomuraea sp. NPDC059194 TaxID=3346764 RepID=UPI0036A8195E
MTRAALRGTGTLVRFVVRRDRLYLLGWIVLFVGIPLFNAATLDALLPTREAREVFARGSEANPITNALLGPIVDASHQGLVAWRSSAQGVLVAGLASVLLVIRHTRAEEEAGRTELVNATAVGRQAGLTAALTVLFATNLTAGLLLSVLLPLVTGFPFAGSLAYGLVLALTGCLYGTAAAVAAQLAQTTALARGISLGVLATGFLPGVSGSDGLGAWLSPIGWTRLTHPYADERWWVLLIPLTLAALLGCAAFALSAGRDLGAGRLSGRTGTVGPPRGAPSLSSPMALTLRLHRETLTGWALAIAIVSAAIGWVSATFDRRFGELGFVQAWLSGLPDGTVGDAFLAIFTFVLILLVGAVTVAITLRPHAEESRGLAAPLLAAPTSRARWLGGHALVAFGGPALLLLLAGLGTGLAYALAAGRADALTEQLARSLLGLPAVWSIAGLAVALYGLLPRIAVPASWAALICLVVLVAAGEAGIISRDAFAFTPFGSVHPMVEFSWTGPITFTLLAAGFLAVGVSAFRRRDLMA